MGKDKDAEIIVPSQEDIKRQEKAAKKEKKNSMLRKVRESYYVAGIAYAILGLGMLVSPEKINGILSYLLGGILVFYAIIALIRFFVGGNGKNFLQMDFIVGVLMAVAGVLIIFIPDLILDLMPLVFGTLLIFGSIINMQDAFELKRCGWSKWKWFMTMAAITMIAGIVFVCMSKLKAPVLHRVIGGVFFVVGINSAVGNIAAEVRSQKE